ncbi:GatB/YqeY domain-containing protein [Candidatus Saccharibacteria bacterium]|nr:GatB/YqeY domain-containing protein [Candidatus Saccharibacteria bacterium]
MSLIDQINADLKAAMLARDDFTVTTLRGLKSAIAYEEIAQNKRETGLSDDEVENVVIKEVKKRDDALKIYVKAGDHERASREDREWKILDKYFPEQLSYEETKDLIATVIAENNFTAKDFGRIVGAAKKRAGNATTGERISNVLKQEFFK